VAHRLVNYEGRITAYLGHGAFELDSRSDRKLFLSHYHIPHLDRFVPRCYFRSCVCLTTRMRAIVYIRAVRIGNMLRLYNVHLIVRPWHSIPYSSDDFSGLVEVREARAHNREGCASDLGLTAQVLLFVRDSGAAASAG
jgi:hypothetical protein